MSLLLEILGNYVVNFPVYNINFETNRSFFLKLFSYITKMVKAKFIYLEKEKSFSDEIKGIFHHF